MRRFVFTVTLVGAVLVALSVVSAQTKPGTAQTKPPAAAAPAPPAPAKWAPPVKGDATVQMLKPTTKQVGKEVVSKVTLKNVSKGSINLLSLTEYWYDRDGNIMPSDTARWRKPLMPGEIITMETRVPADPKLYKNAFMAVHANGKVMLKQVDKF